MSLEMVQWIFLSENPSSISEGDRFRTPRAASVASYYFPAGNEAFPDDCKGCSFAPRKAAGNHSQWFQSL